MRLRLLTIPVFCCVSSCMEIHKVAPSVQDLSVKENVLQLTQGRNLYITRCTKCHNALRITRYSKQQWEETLPIMTKKSKFTPEETRAVSAYIQAVLDSSTSAN
jgi:hypothetical protein